MMFLKLMPWEEAQCLRRIWLMMPQRQRKQSIHPRFRLIRRPGKKSKLSVVRMVLEGCIYCPDKQDAGERECDIQALPCVQMQKYGFEPFFG